MKPKFMKLARHASFFSDHYQHKIGVALVQGNRVIGLGCNKLKTHPKSNTPFSSTHAELSAILRSDRSDLPGSTAYIYRERKDGSPGLAKPCKYCTELLKTSGVKHVVFTTDTGYIEETL